MAKSITQDTFDAVVKENIEEFHMEKEAAVEDARQQFLVQGVDLSNIIIKNDSNTDDDSLLKAVNFLRSWCSHSSADTGDLEDSEESELLKKWLSVIKTECDIDLAHRCRAGSNGVYPVIMNCCRKLSSSGNVKLFQQSLQTLAALFDGQPDLINPGGMEFLCENLKSTLADIRIATLDVILHCCIKHESNRQCLVNMGLTTLLVSALKENNENSVIVHKACAVIRALVKDDDIRVEFGKFHEHARQLVEDGKALEVLLSLATGNSIDEGAVADVLFTVSALTVRDEYCKHISDNGGIKLCKRILADSSVNNTVLLKRAMGLLKVEARNDSVKADIVDAGLVPLVLHATESHLGNASLCEMACSVLSALSLRNVDNCKVIMENGGASVIQQCMKAHPNCIHIQKFACLAVRNLVARSRQYCTQMLELDMESLIHAAAKEHPQIKDVTWAALRDLGCDIELPALKYGMGQKLKK